MESINNVCRLCSSTKDLEYLYDREFVGDKNIDFKDAVLTVTGILILSNDKVSQKICTTCFQTTSEMFQFRVKSRKNDKLLKTQYNDLLKKSGGEQEKPLVPEGIRESKDDFLKKFVSELGNPFELKGIEESNDDCLKKSGGELEKLLELEVIEESTELEKVPEPMEKINEDADEVLEKYPAIMSLLENDSDVSLSVLLRINQPSVSNPEKNRDGKSIIESNPILNDLLNSKTPRKGNIFGRALDPSYKCHICGLARYTPRSLERHMRKHMHCKLCETTFRSMEMTLMHIENYCRAKKIDEYDRYKERGNLNLKELEICFAKFCT